MSAVHTCGRSHSELNSGEKVESDSRYRHLIQYVSTLSSEECQDGHVLNENVSKLRRDGVEGAVHNPHSRNCLVFGEKTQGKEKDKDCSH